MLVRSGVTNVVRKIDHNYNVTTYAGSSTSGYEDGVGTSAEFDEPRGVATDTSGNVYVADSVYSVIRRIDNAQFVETVAGIGGTDTTVNGPGNLATFDSPISIVAAPSGALYVGSNQASTIRLIQEVQVSAAGKARSSPRSE